MSPRRVKEEIPYPERNTPERNTPEKKSPEKLREERRAYATERKISFHTLDGSIPFKGNWLPWHKDIFKQIHADIEMIKTVKMNEFLSNDSTQSANLNSRGQAWKNEFVRRAELINAHVKNCRDEDCNEAGWRSRLEGEVFYHLQHEDVCFDCESAPKPSERHLAKDGHYLTSIVKNFISQVKLCDCSHGEHFKRMFDQIPTRLFSEKIEKHIKLDMGTYMKPDLVHGLKRTESLGELLRTTRKIRQANQKGRSPYEDDDAAVFPFLVVEAKPEKGQFISVKSTRDQVALPFHALLRHQKGLDLNNSQRSESDCGLMVWAIMYSGSRWEVGVGSVEDIEESPNHQCFIIWTGLIEYRDQALQLLLIIDYIRSWAHRFYKPLIIRKLENLQRPEINLNNSTDTRAWTSGTGSRTDPFVDGQIYAASLREGPSNTADGSNQTFAPGSAFPGNGIAQSHPITTNFPAYRQSEGTNFQSEAEDLNSDGANPISHNDLEEPVSAGTTTMSDGNLEESADGDITAAHNENPQEPADRDATTARNENLREPVNGGPEEWFDAFTTTTSEDITTIVTRDSTNLVPEGSANPSIDSHSLPRNDSALHQNGSSGNLEELQQGADQDHDPSPLPELKIPGAWYWEQNVEAIFTGTVQVQSENVRLEGFSISILYIFPLGIFQALITRGMKIWQTFFLIIISSNTAKERNSITAITALRPSVNEPHQESAGEMEEIRQESIARNRVPSVEQAPSIPRLGETSNTSTQSETNVPAPLHLINDREETPSSERLASAIQSTPATHETPNMSPVSLVNSISASGTESEVSTPLFSLCSLFERLSIKDSGPVNHGAFRLPRRRSTL